jgi:hypothetical protein
VATTGAVIYV